MDAQSHQGAGREPDQAGPAGLACIDGTRRRVARAIGGAQFLGRHLARAQHGPADRAQQDHAAEPERVADRIRHDPGRRRVRHPGLGQDPGQGAGDHRADPDEETLHGEAAGALARGQLVADEGAEGLHRDVDRGVEHPQEPRRHPQHRRCRHREQRGRSQQRPDQEVRPAPAQAGPGAVREVSHHRLHQQPGQWSRDPEHRDGVDRRAQGLEDAADIGVLQREAELDAEEAEAHVPDLPERQLRAETGALEGIGHALLHWGPAWHCAGMDSVPCRGASRAARSKLNGRDPGIAMNTIAGPQTPRGRR